MAELVFGPGSRHLAPPRRPFRIRCVVADAICQGRGTIPWALPSSRSQVLNLEPQSSYPRPPLPSHRPPGPLHPPPHAPRPLRSRDIVHIVESVEPRSPSYPGLCRPFRLRALDVVLLLSSPVVDRHWVVEGIRRFRLISTMRLAFCLVAVLYRFPNDIWCCW